MYICIYIGCIQTWVATVAHFAGQNRCVVKSWSRPADHVAWPCQDLGRFHQYRIQLGDFPWGFNKDLTIKHIDKESTNDKC